ncbi:MAG: hypothetical protein L0221_04920 [Chloroflexi bacterium]|nr:hypothetical protein [Chloroflexota bacterium]
MPEIVLVAVIVTVVGVIGVGFGMLLAPLIGRLGERAGRDEEADER